MKKFLIFILVVGILGAAGTFFYDPHLKPFLGPIVESISGTVDGFIGDSKDKIVKDGEKEKVKPRVVSAEKKKPEPKPVEKKTKPAPAPAPPMSEIDKLVASKYPMPNILPLMEIVDNWNNVPRKAYPAAVTLKDKLAFTMMINGNKAASVAVPGTRVQPIQLAGTSLKVASLANKAMINTIDVDKTDFKDQIVARYTTFVDNKRKEVAANRAKAKAALQADTGKLAALKANQGRWDQSGDPKFAPVKASIATGVVGGATLEDATSFRYNASERVGGDLAGTYQTVDVHFEVATIFGKFPADYKCLLSGGKVVGWIDPVTEEKL